MQVIDLPTSFHIQIQLKSLAEEMQAIVKGLRKVEVELKASENDGPASEIFCKVCHHSSCLFKYLVVVDFFKLFVGI